VSLMATLVRRKGRLLTARLVYDSMNHRHAKSVRAGTFSMRQEVGRKARQVLGPLMGAALMVYFGYHAVQGDRGLMAWWNLRFEIEKANTTAAELAAERHAIEQRVTLLRPESLDRDMLEERARIMLGAAGPHDLIVPNPGP
jgi:cell division protein FtsB